MDVELYPSPGIIFNFLEMIKRNEPVLRSPNPKVFVNPVFEIKKGYKMLANKSKLVKYLSQGVVIPFHKEIRNATRFLTSGSRRISALPT